MSFPHEVVARLASQGVGVYNTNIFIGRANVVPDGDGPYLQVIETGGYESSKTQNDTATEHPTAQVLTRAKSAPAARTMLVAAYNALGGRNGLYNITLSSIAYVSLKAMQPPNDVGLDAKGRAMMSFNIEAEKYPS